MHQRAVAPVPFRVARVPFSAAGGPEWRWLTVYGLYLRIDRERCGCMMAPGLGGRELGGVAFVHGPFVLERQSRAKHNATVFGVEGTMLKRLP